MIHTLGDLIYTTTTESIGPQEALSRYASLHVPEHAQPRLTTSSNSMLGGNNNNTSSAPTVSRPPQPLGIRIPDARAQAANPGPSSAPIIPAANSHFGLPPSQNNMAADTYTSGLVPQTNSAPTSPQSNLKRKMEGMEVELDDDSNLSASPRLMKRARGQGR